MSHALPRYRRFEEREDDIKRVVRIIETGASEAKATRGTRIVRHRSAEGDIWRMRCIPVQARGVPSVIPDTDPYSATEKADREGRLWR